MVDLKTLYPELVGFDGLPFALRDGLSGYVPDLQIQQGISFSKLNEFKDDFERQGIYHSACTLISQIGKWANVDVAIEQKLYILTLGDKDEKARVFIEVDTLGKAITFLTEWFGGESVNQLETLEGFRTLLQLDDDLQYIRWQWVSRHRNAVNFPPLTGMLAPLFEEAIKDPVLCQVTPYTSHVTLYLSRCTEYPYLSKEFPLAEPIYHFNHYHRYIIQRKNLEEAERLLLMIPPEYGFSIKPSGKTWDFSNRQGDQQFKGDPIELLEFIVNYAYGRYEVMDRKGTGLETKNAKEAVEFLREALPLNGYPSVRGSADEINLV